MIRYPDSTDARAALRNFAEGYLPGAGEEALAETQTGTWAAWRQVDRAVIAVIDAPTRSRAQKILASIVRRMQ